MAFWITIPYQGSSYRLMVEQLPDDKGKERWEVGAGNKTMLFTNNRPLFLRKNLKHRAAKVKWQNEGDQVNYSHFLELIIAAIEHRLNVKK